MVSDSSANSHPGWRSGATETFHIPPRVSTEPTTPNGVSARAANSATPGLPPVAVVLSTPGSSQGRLTRTAVARTTPAALTAGSTRASASPAASTPPVGLVHAATAMGATRTASPAAEGPRRRTAIAAAATHGRHA